MKKLIIYAIALTTMLSMLAALGACGEKEPLPVSVTNVELNVSSLDLTEGDEVTLTATIAPENAANKAVSWNSSDNTVATVSNGKVMAVKAGKAIITVTTEEGSKTATCEVTVSAKVYPVESVSLDKTSVELTEGDNVTLTATVAPDNATNKNVIWNSSDKTVATVANGKVTAVKAGTATIIVTTEDGGKTATCDVIVGAKVESVSLNMSSVELTEGDEITLIATVTPDNASNKSVIWNSSDETVATVANGKVTAVKSGTATITVTTEDGNETATCEIIVKQKNVEGDIEGTEDEDWNI